MRLCSGHGRLHEGCGSSVQFPFTASRKPASLVCRCSSSERASTSYSNEGSLSRAALIRRSLSGVVGTAAGTALSSAYTPAAWADQPSFAAPEPGQVAMKTLSGSKLAIGFYPTFSYDSSGGGGVATATSSSTPGRIDLSFDPSKVYIPDVTGLTTTFLGIPLLPYLKIAITPTRLEGFANRDTGEVELFFDAEFNFNAGQLYKAPPLYVKTRLTTEESVSRHHRQRGSRLDSNMLASLTGVAEIEPTGDPLMDNFLQLPTDVLAVMRSQFAFNV